MKLLELKEAARVKALKNNFEVLSLTASLHNLLNVINSKSWERLAKKTAYTVDAYNKLIEKMNNSLTEKDLKEQDLKAELEKLLAKY